jgi:tRNA-dihydrouridine synthase A
MKKNSSNLPLSQFLSIAPLMGYSDRHFRYFIRQITEHTMLYTEMIPAGAIAKGKKLFFLDFHPAEKPITLQIGGSDPEMLYQCAKIAYDLGFDGINLNVGCPSSKVQENQMGLCLLKQPSLVKNCVDAMKSGSPLPVSVKTRIGVDDQDSHEKLCEFIQELVSTNLDHLTLHARKGWLKGLSPKENRMVPPLHYDRVYQVREAFPDLSLGINGGIVSLEEALSHLNQPGLIKPINEVMMGRAAIDNPYLFAEADFKIYGDETKKTALTREEILEKMQPYFEQELQKGVSPKQITRHWLGLYHGEPGARAFRVKLST